MKQVDSKQSNEHNHENLENLADNGALPVMENAVVNAAEGKIVILVVTLVAEMAVCTQFAVVAGEYRPDSYFQSVVTELHCPTLVEAAMYSAFSAPQEL